MRELGGRSKSGAWERENQSAEKCWRPQSPRVLPLFLQLIQLVVERLEADAEFGGGSRLVAGVLFQHAEDVFHLDFTQRSGGRSGAGRQGDCGWVAGLRTDMVGQVLRRDPLAAREDVRVL